MGETIKLTDEEIKEMNSLTDGIRKNAIEIGRLTIRKSYLQAEIDEVESMIGDALLNTDVISRNEKTFINQLISKYGEGEINPATGEYTKK